MNRYFSMILMCLTCCAFVCASSRTVATTDIVNTKHNLSMTGPGDLKAVGETRICVFCHTPHNAHPSTPLWNKTIEPETYVTYTSTTMGATPNQPTGPSRLCLSCHDGTIALGAVLQPAEGINMAVPGGIPPDRPSYLGTTLSDDHPVSFSYFEAFSARSNPQLEPPLPVSLTFYMDGAVHCSTCHDPHDNTYKKFLAVDNRRSGLCTSCHNRDGWSVTSHSKESVVWNGTGTNPWPRTGAGSEFNWLTVQDNGCENCHNPHSAEGAAWLLNYSKEEENCYPCHNGNVASINIQDRFSRPSRHQINLYQGLHDPAEYPKEIIGHVECDDCHNPHWANNEKVVAPPLATGRLDGVSGVDINGSPLQRAVNEYEVCFKCHAGPGTQSIAPPIPRVIYETNTQAEFQLINPSYHPIAYEGKNPQVPSLGSTNRPDLTPASRIYCSDCHSDDSGTRGPHGSTYSPILMKMYVTADNTIESVSNYALCYHCHNRASILANESFVQNASLKGGHSGHLGSTVNAPCSACHDPHGIADDLQSGSHTHLINFDTRIVGPATGQTVPLFTDKGSQAGSCTLLCHGVEHTDATHTY